MPIFCCAGPAFFGLNHKEHALAISAAGALLYYIQTTQDQLPQHLDQLLLEASDVYLQLDSASRRNLELSCTLRGDASPTLFLAWMLAQAIWEVVFLSSGYTCHYVSKIKLKAGRKL